MFAKSIVCSKFPEPNMFALTVIWWSKEDVPIQTSTSKGVQGMNLILVLYANGLLLTGNEPLMIKVRGSWLLKLKIMNHGIMNHFLMFGKENIYREAIEEFLESGNENPCTLQLNFKKLWRDIVQTSLEIDNWLKH